MAGISSKSAGTLESQIKFNGKELNEDLDLDWYEYGFRNNFDPQLGRFHSVDPIASDYPFYTPYQFAGNQPTIAVDLDGLEPLFVNEIMQWASEKVVTNPNSGTSKAIGAAIGMGKSIEKTITGTVNAVLHPIETAQSLLEMSTFQGQLKASYGIAEKLDVLQTGSGFDKAVVVGEAVTDVVIAVAGTKGATAGIKAETILGTTGRVENAVGKVKGVQQQASELVASNGNKNRVTLRSQKFQMEVDLQGQAHNYKGNVIETPHTKISPRNTKAPASQQPAYNTSKKHAEYHSTTQQEIRLVRKYLEKQNQ